MGETNSDVIDLGAFAGWLRSWGAAQTTITARTGVLAAVLERWHPITVTSMELAAWLGNPEWSAWTRETYFSHLRSLFDWLRITGQRADDPTRDMRRPSAPRGKPRPLSPGQVRQVLDAATGDLRTWFLLGMLAGLRAHEIAKLRGEDVTESGLYVVGKGGQGAMLPTHSDLWALAQSYPRVGWWFPSPRAASGHVHAKQVTNKTTALFGSLGIEGSSHRARHTFGTNLLRGGANIRVVQELMRHASLATTQGYLDVDDDERRAAIDGLAA